MTVALTRYEAEVGKPFTTHLPWKILTACNKWHVRTGLTPGRRSRAALDDDQPIVDLVGDDTLDIFGADEIPRPMGKHRATKAARSSSSFDATTSASAAYREAVLAKLVDMGLSRSNSESEKYVALRAMRDESASINRKVNLIGVVTDTGIFKRSKSTDCYCTLKIVDESYPSSGISVKFFAETFKKLPHVESAGDIIQLSHVVMETRGKEVYALFNKKYSSFALYDGGDGSKFVPYQVSSELYARKQDKKFIERLRKWTITHQPETVSSGFLRLEAIKEGYQFNLVCKVLHICEVADGEWMLFVWDGTDAPPVNIHRKLEGELENPLPLQLETSPLSRDVLCTFPTVGTVLRMTADRCNEKWGLHLPKVGRWVQFTNINYKIRSSGLWCGIVLPFSKFNYLRNEDNLVLVRQRENDERLKSKWDRKPLKCFPWTSLTDTDYPEVPYVTLMDILSYPEVTGKFKCVVQVLATLPGHPSQFRAPCGTYRLRLTLEDPTTRLHAYLYADDAVKFFGGSPSIDEMIKTRNLLLGVEETDEKPRNPPWLLCCLKSYYVDKSDIWGSRRYRIFGTQIKN